MTSHNVIKEMKAVFARYGNPDVLITDNGPQFTSAEFAVFAKTWMFQHTTSSPYHPQSNGKAHNAVKTVKRLSTKCRESGQLEFLALLDWLNTPTEGVGTSPAQRLMGRRCCCVISTSIKKATRCHSFMNSSDFTQSHLTRYKVQIMTISTSQHLPLETTGSNQNY